MSERDGLRAWLLRASAQRRYVAVSEPRNEIASSRMLLGVSHVSFRVVSIRDSAGAAIIEVRRRMSDFIALRNSLGRRFAGLVLAAPEDGVLGGALADPTVPRATATARRERALTAFAEAVCASPFLAQDPVSIAFFELTPYSAWEALKNSFGKVGAEARIAEQACQRASGWRSDGSGPERWQEALHCRATSELAVDCSSRFDSASRIEESARLVATAARRAATCGSDYAISLSKLREAVTDLCRVERDAFRGLETIKGADSLEALVNDCVVRAELETLRRADAIERYLGAPMRDEAAQIAACREGLSGRRKIDTSTELSLKLEAQRVAAKFANRCKSCHRRLAAAIRFHTAQYEGPDAKADVADSLLAIAVVADQTDEPYATFLHGNDEAPNVPRQKQARKAAKRTSRTKEPKGSTNPFLLELAETEKHVSADDDKPGDYHDQARERQPPPPPARRAAAPPPLQTNAEPPARRPSAAGPAAFLADIRKFDSSTLTSCDEANSTSAQIETPSSGLSLMSEMMARRRSQMISDDAD